MTEEFLNITQVAERLGVRERVIQHYVNVGAIHCKRIGKALRFRWKDIDAWWESLPEIHPAIYTATHPVTNGISEGSHGTSEPPISLMRGPRGHNREQLAKG